MRFPTYRKDKQRKKTDRRERMQMESSLRERANMSMLRRKKQLRTRLILMNSAIALIIILIVLVCKVVALNRGNVAADLEKKDKVLQEASQKKKVEKKTKEKKKEKATPIPMPVMATGSDRWIRRDLDPDKPMVALTFDDGPYAPVTEKILSVLKKNDARATFFCVGNRFNRYKGVVTKAYDQGCQIASHTYDHVRLTSVKKKKVKYQIDKTDKTLKGIIGCETTALRPPGGFVNAKVRKIVDVPMVCWSVDTEDWRSRNKKKILKKCKSIKDGDIILMHDLYPSTAAAVKKLVPSLKKKGYELVTVDELFYYKGIKTEAGKVYFSGK